MTGLGSLKSPFDSEMEAEEQEAIEAEAGRLEGIISASEVIAGIQDHQGWKFYRKRIEDIYTRLHKNLENCKPQEFITIQAQLKIVKEVADIFPQLRREAEAAKLRRRELDNDQSI